MAYDFMGLVNKICHKMNEVPLTTSNFASANGFYSDAKDSVNSAIDDINHDEFQWPFNHSLGTQVLTVDGTVRYAIPADAKAVNWNSFRVRRNDTFGNDTVFLHPKDYEFYIKYIADAEYDTANESIRTVPNTVYEDLNRDIIIYPPADNAYTVDFDYYILPTPLVNPTDVPTAPVAFESVIYSGSLHYAYEFRSDIENSQKHLSAYNRKLKAWRRVYSARQRNMKDNRVIRSVADSPSVRIS